jgi:DNA-binding IclR family transcriptional regulator
VRSAEVGTDILKALAELSPSTSLSRLAEHVQMPASKVHRYLQALIARGLPNRTPPPTITAWAARHCAWGWPRSTAWTC